MKPILAISLLFMLAFSGPAAAIDPCNCKGYAGPVVLATLARAVQPTMARWARL